MESILNAFLLAPLPNLLIVSGLVFLGLFVLGGISGKIEPGREGRIASGGLGALLLLIGFYLALSGAGLPQSVRTVVSSPLDAPLPNVLIVAGLIFLGIATLGGISGKFEPDRQGRIGAGIVGGVLMLLGLVLVFNGGSQAAASSQPAPTLVAVAPPATNTPAPVPSATPTPNPSPTFPPPSTLAPLPPAAQQALFYVPHREATVNVIDTTDLSVVDVWDLQILGRAQSQFSQSFVSTVAGDIVNFGIAEHDARYLEAGTHAAQTFELVQSTGTDNRRHYSLTWYFPPSVNITRTFELRYVLRKFVGETSDGTQAIRYIATMPRGFIEGTVHFIFKLPRVFDPAAISAQALLNGANVSGARVADGQTVEFSAQNLAPDTTWELQVRYPKP